MPLDSDNKPQWLRQAEEEFDRDLLIGKALGAVYRRENKTEPYVCIPPAFMISDSDGAVFTFGFNYRIHNGEYEFNVLRNDIDTGEMAKRIEYRKGVVRIFGQYGWKTFSRNRTGFIKPECPCNNSHQGD